MEHKQRPKYYWVSYLGVAVYDHLETPENAAEDGKKNIETCQTRAHCANKSVFLKMT